VQHDVVAVDVGVMVQRVDVDDAVDVAADVKVDVLDDDDKCDHDEW
jgi:hypothetical protein